MSGSNPTRVTKFRKFNMTDKCDHGLTFDLTEANKILSNRTSNSANEIRRRWPRLSGPCPKGCGFNGIAYSSIEHYIAGDW